MYNQTLFSPWAIYTRRGKTAEGAPTPRKKSRSIPVQAQLEYVTVEELKSCPAYVKGRLTVDKLNSAVDELQTFFAKEVKTHSSLPLSLLGSKNKEPKRSLTLTFPPPQY